jgi:hypothetical protein
MQQPLGLMQPHLRVAQSLLGMVQSMLAVAQSMLGLAHLRLWAARSARRKQFAREMALGKF